METEQCKEAGKGRVIPTSAARRLGTGARQAPAELTDVLQGKSLGIRPWSHCSAN